MKIKYGLSKFFCKSPLTVERKEDRKQPIPKEHSTNALPQKVQKIECIEKQNEVFTLLLTPLIESQMLFDLCKSMEVDSRIFRHEDDEIMPFSIEKKGNHRVIIKTAHVNNFLEALVRGKAITEIEKQEVVVSVDRLLSTPTSYTSSPEL
ncbi:MAG: hypothetical protein M3R00_02905 [Pseudomonadota bacterium]|nr:hypothetical protein [Pseudomonadota bacterium]